MTGRSDATARRRPRRTHKTLVGACSLALVLLLTCSACKSDYPAGTSQTQVGAADGTARPVHTARVAELPVGNTISVTGQLAAQDQATLSVKVPGRLRTVTVDLGSIVRQGQTVAQLEQPDYQLRVQQAEAALGQARARLGLAPEGTDDKVEAEQTGTVRQARAVMDEARTTRERTDTLVKQGVVSRAEWDAADAAYKVAVSRFQDAVEEIRNRQALLSQRRAELALARQQLTDTTVVAPFDGVVQERKASVGEYLAAGAAVVTIVRVNPLRFRAEVPERDAASVKMGQRVNVTVEGAQNVYGGRVVRLSPSISEQNRVLIVEAEVINNGTLRPGSFARADIITSDTSKAVTVPSNAIVTFAGIEKVIVVQNGKAQEKPVTTGRRGDTWTEIVSGINVGDAVVLDPGNLQSGQPVNVVE
jgi:RND family efflux transporter MFP subunit